MKKISISALIATTFLAVPIAYGMEVSNEEIDRPSSNIIQQKLPTQPSVLFSNEEEPQVNVVHTLAAAHQEAELRQQPETLSILQQANSQEDFEKLWWANHQKTLDAESKAELENKQKADAQAKFEKDYWDDFAKKQKEAEQELIFGRTPDKIVHNAHTELDRGLKGVHNVFNGEAWDHNRNVKK